MFPNFPSTKMMSEVSPFLWSFGTALIILHHQLKTKNPLAAVQREVAQHMEDSCPNLPCKNTSNQGMLYCFISLTTEDKLEDVEVLVLQGG
jgi:hypothetical protein